MIILGKPELITVYFFADSLPHVIAYVGHAGVMANRWVLGYLETVTP